MARHSPLPLWALILAILTFHLVNASQPDVFPRNPSLHRRHHARQNTNTSATVTSITHRSLVERAPPSGWNLFIKSGNDGGGCYVDSNAARILTGYSGNDANNGLQSCLNTCQAKGFTYGGVQYGTQCYVSYMSRCVERGPSAMATDS